MAEEPRDIRAGPGWSSEDGAAKPNIAALLAAAAEPIPSARGYLRFGVPRDGAVSRCDLILDLAGSAPLFPAADLRDGYLRADPGDPAAVLRAALKAGDLVGTFDKPRYVTFTAEL